MPPLVRCVNLANNNFAHSTFSRKTPWRAIVFFLIDALETLLSELLVAYRSHRNRESSYAWAKFRSSFLLFCLQVASWSSLRFGGDFDWSTWYFCSYQPWKQSWWEDIDFYTNTVLMCSRGSSEWNSRDHRQSKTMLVDQKWIWCLRRSETILKRLQGAPKCWWIGVSTHLW